MSLKLSLTNLAKKAESWTFRAKDSIWEKRSSKRNLAKPYSFSFYPLILIFGVSGIFSILPLRSTNCYPAQSKLTLLSVPGKIKNERSWWWEHLTLPWPKVQGSNWCKYLLTPWFLSQSSVWYDPPCQHGIVIGSNMWPVYLNIIWGSAIVHGEHF